MGAVGDPVVVVFVNVSTDSAHVSGVFHCVNVMPSTNSCAVGTACKSCDGDGCHSRVDLSVVGELVWSSGHLASTREDTLNLVNSLKLTVPGDPC